ncbi:hypothetical protein HK098_004032 [Nowakowskiella sp. JEL0407]|nr:hypothetical protein HK098_004032 [Nowakowskiella sp. JEL0407]
MAHTVVKRKQRGPDWTWIAISVVVMQMLAVGVFEALVMSKLNSAIKTAYENSDSAETLPFIFVFFALFLFAQVFVALLVIDAAITLNTMQIIATSGFNFLVFLYSIIQIFSIRRLKSCIEDTGKLNPTLMSANKTCEVISFSEASCNCPGRDNWTVELAQHFRDSVVLFENVEPWSVIVAGAMGLFLVLNGIVAFQTYTKWGWRIYEQSTGADLEKRSTPKILRLYHLFILFIKVNLFFVLSFLIQIVVLFYFSRVKKETNPMFLKTELKNGTSALTDTLVLITLSISIVASIAYIILGYWCSRTGNKLALALFLVIIVLNFVAGVVVSALPFISSYRAVFQIAKLSIPTVGILCVLLNIVLFVLSIMSLKSFRHKEYRDIVSPPKAVKRSEIPMNNLELD